MLQSEYVFANIGFDTAESEPRQILCEVRAREPADLESFLADRFEASLLSGLLP